MRRTCLDLNSNRMLKKDLFSKDQKDSEKPLTETNKVAMTKAESINSLLTLFLTLSFSTSRVHVLGFAFVGWKKSHD